MTRRLTLVILATVAATLLVAGGGTLLLARFGARQHTEDELRSQVTELAASIDDLNNQGALRLLANLRNTLNLEGIEVMRFGPAGRTIDEYPEGVQPSDIDLDALRNGETLSGNHGSLVYAAAPANVGTRAANNRGVLAVVVLTRQADTPLRPATGWFLVAAIATLAIGALVAWRFGRRLTRPLRDAQEATTRISAGDLSTRLSVAKPGSKDELTSLAESINAMAEALERSKGLERQFLLSVSHDLRTPLTSIQGYAEAIADSALPDPSEGGAVILSEARRLDRLVDDLLDLAKLESRQFSMTIEPVDLADVVAATVDGFRPEADDASIALELRAPNEPITVEGDSDRLAQVTGNLVQNALKYARSRIVVAVGVTEAWARLDVIDDGPGIAAEDQPHVFERLYVARRQPDRRETGSGLGLAIVRELVTAMRGQVQASAATGQHDTTAGACLSVFLPFAGPVRPPVSSAPEAATIPTTPTSPTTEAPTTVPPE
ncbi:MAG TPA: HAMP domain-containing sensor histidine kinase [Acidimicrobiales bacterium]|jgi:two-component system sensor histidine kinase BaeS|nr:HAMP domain-containing sensor histidine kinase [Acidimicrobiales bacterium]